MRDKMTDSFKHGKLPDIRREPARETETNSTPPKVSKELQGSQNPTTRYPESQARMLRSIAEAREKGYDAPIAGRETISKRPTHAKRVVRKSHGEPFKPSTKK